MEVGKVHKVNDRTRVRMVRIQAIMIAWSYCAFQVRLSKGTDEGNAITAER